MIRLGPRGMILVGLFLVVAGFVLPLLIMIQVLESTLLLNFLAYTAQVLGLLFGLIGSAQIASAARHTRRDE